MTTDHARITQALAEAAKTVYDRRSLEDTLDSIVASAVLALPEFDHAGVSIMHRDGRIETVAGTDQLVWELDTLQYSIGEGPCVDSITQDRVVLVENAERETRWPQYMPQAVEHGLRAQLGLHLNIDPSTKAGINLYSTSTGEIDRDSVHLAELFATQAATALGRARSEDTLNQAVATRKVIGQAIGIISERYRITDDRAFQFLVRASQDGNLKLRAVAQEVVDSTNERYAAEMAAKPTP